MSKCYMLTFLLIEKYMYDMKKTTIFLLIRGFELNYGVKHFLFCFSKYIYPKIITGISPFSYIYHTEVISFQKVGRIKDRLTLILILDRGYYINPDVEKS